MAETSTGSRPRLRRTEVDGVPTLWVPGPAPMRAGLMFRVGRADESLAWGGITHLVEHLALSGLGKRPYALNGQVDDNRTGFFVAGTTDEVGEFLSSLTTSLGTPPTDRVAVERQILLTEAA